MKKTLLSRGWNLNAPGFNGNVDLPNDYTVTQPRSPQAPGGTSNGFFVGGEGRYTRFITPPADAEHMILDFDGAYMYTEVYFNDDLITNHVHGYTPFLVDISDRIRPGRPNKITVTTDDMMPSSRWYAGAGLYRDVFLWEGGAVRVEPRDVFITTPEADETSAKVVVNYDISADSETKAVVSAAAYDDAGAEAASGTLEVRVCPWTKTRAVLELTIPAPKLWDTENPNLYTLKTVITSGGRVTDEAENIFGIRTISADPKNGLLLNGRPIKLRGGCIHHDHGVLGAAAFPAAEYRKLSRLKDAGFNSVRIAHNPPSTALLEVCDRIGMIVMTEAFDMWNMRKTKNDYHKWFRDRWAEDIAAMVLRDRQHPCVFSYSIGNEIGERGGRSDGYIWAKKLADEVRKYDSTRFVTSGICLLWDYPNKNDPEEYQADFMNGYADIGNGTVESSWGKRTEKFMEPLDIVGYNYLWRRYENDAKEFPDRVIWGSETHAVQFWDSWNVIMSHSNVLGDYTWTAYDNMGETGCGAGAWERDQHIDHIFSQPWPWRTCWQGDLDLCGYRRPQSYFREAVWLGGIEPRIFTTHPEHYGEAYGGTGWHWYDVLDSWTFEDRYLGRPVKCEVYTDADEIEWFINGCRLGTSKPVKAIAAFTVPYERGVLSVKAYKNGVCVGESKLETVDEASGITLVPERKSLAADNRDLLYVDVIVTDNAGRRVPHSKNALKASIVGGELMGIYSGDPANEDRYGSKECHAFEGRALAVIRASRPGDIRFTVYGEGLAGASVTIKAE